LRQAGSEAITAELSRPGRDQFMPSPQFAVRAVLLRTAGELAKAMQQRTKESAYELFDRAAESYPPLSHDSGEPESFAERFVRASHDGERVLKDWISREAAAWLGEATPSSALRREINRRIGLFEALAFEGLLRLS
jgi:hypothetical protein